MLKGEERAHVYARLYGVRVWLIITVFNCSFIFWYTYLGLSLYIACVVVTHIFKKTEGKVFSSKSV